MATGNDARAQRLAGDPKLSLLLCTRLCIVTYLAGDPKRKEWDPAAGTALYTYIGIGKASEKGKRVKKGVHAKGK